MSLDESFGLENDEFWTDPLKGDEAISDRLLEKGLSRVLLAGPAKVGPGRETLPLVCRTVLTLQEEQALDFDRLAVLAASQVDGNHVSAARAIQPRRYPKDELEDDPDAVCEGWSAQAHLLDARERLFFSEGPATYILRVLIRDRISNPVRVTFTAGAGEYDDAAVAEFLRARQQNVVPAAEPEEAPDGPVSHRRRPDWPEPPAEAGIVLQAERVVALEPDGRWPIRAGFRLPVQPWQRVPAAARRPGGPAAVIGIALVLVGADDPGPVVHRLCVPVCETAGEPALATGGFELDLLRADGTPRAQTYFAYAFSGEAFAGPAPTALVALDTARKAAHIG